MLNMKNKEPNSPYLTLQTPESALELRGVSYLYPSMSGHPPRGIHPCSLKLTRGQVYGLIGANGAGKTTLFKLISGALTPQIGQIYLSKREVTHLPQWRRVRCGLGYLTQGDSLVSHMSVEWNLKIGLEAKKRWSQSTSSSIDHLTNTDHSTEGMKESISFALAKVGLSQQSRQSVMSLSGGERRRAEMARLLVMRPQVILLDEPFAAIDEAGLSMMMDIIGLARAWGALVLLTDHQTQYVNDICQSLLILDKGKLQRPQLS